MAGPVSSVDDEPTPVGVAEVCSPGGAAAPLPPLPIVSPPVKGGGPFEPSAASFDAHAVRQRNSPPTDAICLGFKRASVREEHDPSRATRECKLSPHSSITRETGPGSVFRPEGCKHVPDRCEGTRASWSPPVVTLIVCDRTPIFRASDAGGGAQWRVYMRRTFRYARPET